jgi:hypothetical protein
MMLSRRRAAVAALLALSASTVTPALAEASGRITLGNASNGSSVTVRQGTTVVVDLKGSVGAGTEFLWSLPMASPPSVLSLRSESQSGAETRAVYVASQAGAATITSDEACRVTAPGHACPLFILLWRVGVTVTP